MLPDLIASSLAPTTCYSYKLHYSKFYVWCQRNNRRVMPPDEEAICVYFSFLAVKNRSPNTVLVTRSAIRFFQRIAFPDLEPPTDSPRVAALVIG